MIYFILFNFILFVFCLMTLIRNNMVYRYRISMLNRIFDATRGTENFDKYIEIYKSVSYHEMLYKFWKSFDSFYPEELTTLV